MKMSVVWREKIQRTHDSPQRQSKAQKGAERIYGDYQKRASPAETGEPDLHDSQN